MPLKSFTRTATVVAATAAAGASGAVIANAASSSSTTPAPPASQPYGGGLRGGPAETALTGDTKQKVEAAALAKVPGGTIIRSETDAGGAYEAHVRKGDGTEVEVRVAKDFTVTGVQTRPAGGTGGPGGHGHGPGGPGGPRGDLTATAKALGVTEAKLRSAVEAARPDKGPGRDDLAGALAKQLGESTTDVQAVLDASRPSPDRDRGRDRGRPGPGDDSTLAAALAKTFSITQAKAQAALDAVHKAKDADRSAQQTAFYAAVAKALGQDAAAVQKAFEANRPAPPTP